ncbi:MAG: glycosyltransferase family 4 protein, partial [Leptospiraceae bacterium]|nr:glycosyltransferase family 4 protein [Leptospiraceae bacterium]
RIPLVTTIHTTTEWQIKGLDGIKFNELEFSEKMTKIFSPALIWLENRYYKKRKYFITVSEFGKKLISKEKTIEPERIRVIYNGVDPEKFNPKNRKVAEEIYREIVSKNGVKILYLSRFIAKKGLYVFLKAIPKVLNKVDAHFIFAGPGIKPNFEAFGISKDSYTYLGYVYSTQHLHSLADIFVLPSFMENFPISILEAMASEVCVVSTNVGGIPEVIKSGYNGTLIPPNKLEALVQALLYLVENEEERKRLAKNARKTVLKNFTWKKCADLTLQYYEEVIENESLAN